MGSEVDISCDSCHDDFPIGLNRDCGRMITALSVGADSDYDGSVTAEGWIEAAIGEQAGHANHRPPAGYDFANHHGLAIRRVGNVGNGVEALPIHGELGRDLSLSPERRIKVAKPGGQAEAVLQVFEAQTAALWGFAPALRFLSRKPRGFGSA